MAKLELPSIVVQTNYQQKSKIMKKTGSLQRAQRTLSKQAEFDEEEPIVIINTTTSSSSDSNNVESKMISVTNQTENQQPPLANSPRLGAMVTGAQRNRTNNKVKLLVRSQAIRESTSPPRDPHAECSQLSPIMVQSTTPELPQCCSNRISPNLSPNDNSEPKMQQAGDNNQYHCDNNLRNTTPIDNQESSSSPRNSTSSTNNNRLTRQIITISCQNCTEHDCNHCNTERGNSEQQHQHRALNNNNLSGNSNFINSNTLTVNNRVNKKLKHQNSSSFESTSASPCLSRDSSTEQYTDTSGINLSQFIMDTLNRNAKDRHLMLKIEHELVNLAKDKSKTHYKFPPMSSYQRMLVHRCAAFFGMDHNIEASGKCVIVNKTKSTRLPEFQFQDHIRDDLLFPEEPRKSILKRDSNSFEECFSSGHKSPERQMLCMENRRSKSFEEREEEYEKVRRRIFNREHMHDCGSQEELAWAEIPWSSSDSDNSSRMRLLPPDHPTYRPTRLLKGQSVEAKDTLRPCVSKSFSFGGYTGAVSLLSRGDSVTSTHSAGARLLTKQDSGTSSITMSWRLSPSSSGYKSQSQRSDSVTPSPTATPFPPVTQQTPIDENQPAATTVPTSWENSSSPTQTTTQTKTIKTEPETSTNSDFGNNNQMVWTSYNNQQQKRPPTMVWHPNMNYNQHENDVHQNKPVENQPKIIMWAITDLKEVPKGSHIINSETGAPFKNPDGTDYAFDPQNLHPALLLMLQSSEASLNAGNHQYPSPPNHIPQQQPHDTYQNKNISNSKPPYKPPLQRTNSKPIYNNQYSQGQNPGNKTYPNNKQSPPLTSNKPPLPGKSPPNGTTGTKPQSPSKKVDSLQSPKKFSKFQPKLSATKPKGFTNSATSPSLPFTPPQQVYGPGGFQYVGNGQYENAQIATFPLGYNNNGGVYSTPMVPVHNSSMPVYGDETSSMVYGYGVPQYARMDSVSELNGYFVNMNLNGDVATNASNGTQPIAYQSTTPYWGHQPMVCYVPPQNATGAQRYPVPLGQSGYLSTYASAQTNQTYTSAAGSQQQTNAELLPLYPPGPPPIVYGHPPPVVASGGQTNPIVYANQAPPLMYTPNMPMYAATPNLVYASANNAVYPAATNTPNSTYSNNSTYTPSSAYSNSGNQDKKKNFTNSVKNNNPRVSTSNVSTNSTSGSSNNSPASTVVQTHYNQYSATGVPFNRHCSPSETPPNSYPGTVTYGYQQFQQNCGPMPPTHILPQQTAMVYRNNVQVAIRASPPVNSRTSRSPTPTVDHYDRSNRNYMATSLYQTVPCVVPGDMRFMSPRQQMPYKNAYNRPPFPQSIDSPLGRPPKIRKPRN